MEESPDRETRQTSFDDSFATVMDDLIEGCQIVDREWRYLYVNQTVVRQARRSREELIGRTMMEVYPGIDETSMFGVLRECMEHRVVHHLENEFTYPDGSTGWFELRFNPVLEGVFILSLDITERKEAEARLGHLNAVLRGVRDVNQLITREKDQGRLIQSACELLVDARGFRAVMIGLTDESWRMIACASAGEELDRLGDRLARGEVPDCAREAMTRGEILRRDSPGNCDGDCACAAGFAEGNQVVAIALEHERQVFGFMLLFVPPHPGDVAEEDSLLQEAAGDLGFALHTMETRADRELARKDLGRAEEQLRQSQKLEAIGRLAGGIAHDFNNLLMVQIGYCDMIMERLDRTDPLASELSEVLTCAERAARLTRQLLAFSRKQALRPQVLNLNDVARDVEKLLRRLIGEDIELLTRLDEDLGQVEADPGQLEQVIMNLAVNARDAMPEGGRLTLETANVELDEAYAESSIGVKAGSHVMLAISDTGTGMDEATRKRLFEPFFTTKAKGKGTGLGLATVYGIVKQSGGNIWVYSEPGGGTTFKIYLPRVKGKAKRGAKPVASELHGAGESILVVEDDPALRTLLTRMLEALGFEGHAAPNGNEALARLEAGEVNPVLLITDVVLPGMGGSELAERAQQLRPGLKVVYTSGYTDAAILHRGVLKASTPFLQKPFTRNDLATKLREALEGD